MFCIFFLLLFYKCSISNWGSSLYYYVCRFVYSIPYLSPTPSFSFHIYGVCCNIPCFIPYVRKSCLSVLLKCVNFILFSKNQIFVLLVFFIVWCFNFIDFCSPFFFLLLDLDLFCSLYNFGHFSSCSAIYI